MLAKIVRSSVSAAWCAGALLGAAAGPAAAQNVIWTGAFDPDFFNSPLNWSSAPLPPGVDATVIFTGGPTDPDGVMILGTTTHRALYVLHDTDLTLAPYGAFTATNSLVVGGAYTTIGGAFSSDAALRILGPEAASVIRTNTLSIGTFSDFSGSGIGGATGLVTVDGGRLETSVTALGRNAGDGSLHIVMAAGWSPRLRRWWATAPTPAARSSSRVRARTGGRARPPCSARM